MNKKKKTKLTDTLKTKTDLKSLPIIKEDLINALDELFPEASADLQWSEKEVWFKAGQRSVVNWLKDLKKRSEDNLLGGQ